MSVGILLAKAFIILVVCFVVRNNSCGNSSSSNFFLFNLNIVPVLFLLILSFNLLNCVFVSLTFPCCWFPVFYNTVSVPLENFDVVSLVFSKIVKINIDSASSAFIPSTFFSCPTNYVCWIAFWSASNSFYLLKSVAINLSWFLM